MSSSSNSNSNSNQVTKRRWTKNGKVLRAATSRLFTVNDELRISSLGPTDQANYSCIVGDEEEAVTYALIVMGNFISTFYEN